MGESEVRFTSIPGMPSKYCQYLLQPFETGRADTADLVTLEQHTDGCEFCRAFYAGYFAEDDEGGA